MRVTLIAPAALACSGTLFSNGGRHERGKRNEAVLGQPIDPATFAMPNSYGAKP